MSTSWGYHCATCNVSTEHWWNHGDDQLRLIAQNWALIKPVYELTQTTMWRIEIKVMDWYDNPDPLGFLAEHHDHQVLLENEYGDRRPIGQP